MSTIEQARTDAPDVITTAVVQSGLVAAAKEMSSTLERAAYNPLLFELKDYSAAILDREGRLWAEAPGLIAFLSGIPDLVQFGLAKHGADGLQPGDVLIANDPFSTGTHISDTTTYMPVFVEGELVAFTATTAHWADIGGKTPGGWCSDSIDVFQEGLRFPHVKLFRAGELDETLLEVTLANVRLPTTVRGDLEAQIAACRTGSERVTAVVERYGVATARAAMDVAMDASERAMRSRIAALPDGVYSAATEMDHDGVEKDVPRPLKVKLTVAGDKVTADLTGTSGTASGPINLPLSGTRGAVNAALKSILAPTEPANDGEFRVLEVIAPPDTMVNPSPPAPCDSYGYVFQTLVDLTIAALAGIAPERCPAGSGQMFGIYAFRTDNRRGDPFIFIDAATVGWGASSAGDGTNLVFVIDGDTPNVPAEIIETRYPLLMTTHALLPGREGAGKHRGGLGLVREFEMREDHIWTQGFMGNDVNPPRGIGDGASASNHRIVLRPGEPDEEVRLERFGFGGPLNTGERIRAEAGGGGGWGSPLERDPEAVRDDVLNEIVTREDAAEIYGVALVGERLGLRVDAEATERLRAQRA
jgi:N-methylhydantoinase B